MNAAAALLPASAAAAAAAAPLPAQLAPLIRGHAREHDDAALDLLAQAGFAGPAVAAALPAARLLVATGA